MTHWLDLSHVGSLLGQVLAQDGAQRPPGMGGLADLMIPVAMIAVLFYLLLWRPQRRERAAVAEMLKNLKKNDRVVTIGGIYGTVVTAAKDSDEVTIKVDESTNTKLRMQRAAIARVLSGGDSSAETA